MAKIVGVEGMTVEQLEHGIAGGGKFVMYQFIISILILSFKRSSAIYYVPPGQSRVTKGLPWCGVSLVLGWWGLPWGLIWTPMAIYKNLTGGIDVTSTVCQQLIGKPAALAVGPEVAVV